MTKSLNFIMNAVGTMKFGNLESNVKGYGKKNNCEKAAKEYIDDVRRDVIYLHYAKERGEMHYESQDCHRDGCNGFHELFYHYGKDFGGIHVTTKISRQGNSERTGEYTIWDKNTNTDYWGNVYFDGDSMSSKCSVITKNFSDGSWVRFVDKNGNGVVDKKDDVYVASNRISEGKQWNIGEYLSKNNK